MTGQRKENPKQLLSSHQHHLIALLTTLGQRTGKNTQNEQGAALGVPSSSWSRWLNGALPKEKKFGEILQKAQLTPDEKKPYWQAWKAASDHPSFTLPEPPGPPDSATRQEQPTPIPLPPQLAEQDPDREEGAVKLLVPAPDAATAANSSSTPPNTPSAPRSRTTLQWSAIGIPLAMAAAAAFHFTRPDGTPSPPPLSLAATPPEPSSAPASEPCDRYLVTADDMSLRTQDNVRTKEFLQQGEIAIVKRRGTPNGRTRLWYIVADDKQGWILSDSRYWRPHC
ncbi:hypothetical protein [Actinocorallia aurantiaca]